MKTKIYHLKNDEDKICYVGSTTTSLKKRLIDHRHKTKYRKNYTIELIEEVPLDKRYIFEQYYMDFYRDIIGYELENKQRCLPFKNKEYYKQYYEDNKEYYKQYNEDNKESLTEYKKKYYEDNKEYHKQYNKQYYEDNKESLTEYKKKYYQTQKLLQIIDKQK